MTVRSRRDPEIAPNILTASQPNRATAVARQPASQPATSEDEAKPEKKSKRNKKKEEAPPTDEDQQQEDEDGF